MTPQLLLSLKLFLLMGLGLFLRKIHMINDGGKTLLNDLVLKVVLPCTIVTSFFMDLSKEILINSWQTILISLVLQIISFFFALFIYRPCKPEHRTILKYGTICSNSGTMGTPVAAEIFGAEGVLLSSLYCTPLRIAMWTLGISFFAGSKKENILKKLLTNPCIIAIVIGLICMTTGFRFPDFLTSTMNTLGVCNTPLTMILIGSLIADMDYRQFWHPDILYFCVIRFVLLPGLVFAACNLMHTDLLARNICVVLTAMPMGCTTPLLAFNYKNDVSFASACTAFSTLLSLIAVPVWCSILM